MKFYSIERITDNEEIWEFIKILEKCSKYYTHDLYAKVKENKYFKILILFLYQLILNQGIETCWKGETEDKELNSIKDLFWMVKAIQLNPRRYLKAIEDLVKELKDEEMA